MNISTVPHNNEPFVLFKYCVRKVIELNLMNEKNSHQYWANRIFGYERKASVRGELMSIVKREFPTYFSSDFGNYGFIEDKIRRNFPYFFGIEENQSLFDRMFLALEAELEEQKKPCNLKIYKISSCKQIAYQDEQYVYKAQLIVEEDDDPRFSEGIGFDFRTPTDFFNCEVVEYDFSNALLFFSCKRKIYSSFDARVVSDATMNTIALKNLLEEIFVQRIDETLPIHKFINGTTKNLKSIEHDLYPDYLKEMLSRDNSQFEAFEAALDKDITFIWGPPGTGKSYTLSAIIMALYKMAGERTVVCCLSNVAVDQLVNKVVDIIEVQEPDMQRGHFYRAGRTRDERLLATDFLFPDDLKAFSLRRKIKKANEEIDILRKEKKQYSDEAIKIKAKLKDLREELKEHTDYLISQVKVVFSTIANFVINKKLYDYRFDNLIVDEVSMLAQPQLIALASKITKRIILVGDFQQLSPITTTGLPMLKNSVFKLCGIDIANTDHPGLHQLLNQRRSNPKLVDIINHSFYADKLVAQNNENHPIVVRAPFSCNVVGMISVDDGAVRFTKGGTRQNVANATAVIKLLDLYSKKKEDLFSIGVITPYTGQVALLKRLFIDKEYDTDFQDRVKIGTVHTFQGSECDVIIFDMVDCSKFEKGTKVYFGKIYAGEQGEQLLNVAISRARHKLIVVCDPELLDRCPGGVVSDKSKIIFNNLLKSRLTRV